MSVLRFVDDVGQLIQELVAGYEGADFTSEGDMVVPCRPQALKRSLNNLLENAKRFASKVAVHASRTSDVLTINIDDDGPGISDDKFEEVFRPFTRLETSRNQNTGGVGLGLAIARDGMRSHGGDVTLAASPLGGLRAIIRIPI